MICIQQNLTEFLFWIGVNNDAFAQTKIGNNFIIFKRLS